jgi:uncharacterized DUF497 family protein
MDYYKNMKFEWDELKNTDCFVKRGFDFIFASQVFFDPDRFIKPDERTSCDEDRYQVMGLINARLYVVVYTPRENTIRIISARKANKREIYRYENHTSHN